MATQDSTAHRRTPEPELTNEQRAKWGEQWLLAYPLADEYETPEGHDFETMALDALADLFHFLNQCELPWEGIIDQAKTHFEAERDGRD